MTKEQVEGDRFGLYDRAAIESVLDRMTTAAAALLREAEDPLLLGILRRGAPLADIVGIRLQLAPDDVVECGVPPYEDDLRIELLRQKRG